MQVANRPRERERVLKPRRRRCCYEAGPLAPYVLVVFAAARDRRRAAARVHGKARAALVLDACLRVVHEAHLRPEAAPGDARGLRAPPVSQRVRRCVLVRNTSYGRAGLGGYALCIINLPVGTECAHALEFGWRLGRVLAREHQGRPRTRLNARASRCGRSAWAHA